MYNEKNFVIADNCPMYRVEDLNSNQFLSYISNTCDNCIYYKSGNCKMDMYNTISNYLLQN